jgi:hypothetical protein
MRARRRGLRPGRKAAALGLYCALSFAYFGLPVASEPSGRIVGHGHDPDIFVWSFAWWPHALVHGLNPIVTHAIWAPDGIGLAWTASTPGLALAFAPLTLLAGPVAAYNVAAVLMPALAAWTAFLLCRYLTRQLWPSLLGGYLFGFSSYMLAHAQGHLQATSIFLVPLVALVVLRYLDRRIDGLGLALQLGVLLGAQLWLSIEFAFSVTLALLVALAAAAALVPARRPRIASLPGPLAGAYAIGAVLAAPLLYYVLTDFSRSSVNEGRYVADLANVVVPTRLVAIGGSWAAGISARFPGNDAEQAAYLGLPLLAILGVFFVTRRGHPGTRVLLACTGVAAVAALGSELFVAGHRVAPLPWWLLDRLPVFDNMLPARLMLYATLAASVAAALWLASRAGPAWLRISLPALAVVALVPDLSLGVWHRTPSPPAFFAQHRYEDCVRRGDNLLVVPYGYTGDSLLWQATSGFYFRMAGGDIGPIIPAGFAGTPVIRLLNDDVRVGDGGTVLELAKRKGASAIVVDDRDPWPWKDVLAGIGTPERVGGMLLYPLEPGPATSAVCTSTPESAAPTG